MTPSDENQTITLTLKSENLQTAIKANPKLEFELEQIIASAQVEERRIIEHELGISNLSDNSVDPHYGLYSSLFNYNHPKVSEAVILDMKATQLKEAIKEVSLDDYKHLKNLYEALYGADISTPSSGGAVQSGSVLKKRQTEAEFRLVQLIINSRYNTDPYARNIIDTISRYMISNGISVKVEDKKIQEILDNFIKNYSISDLLKDWIKSTLKDGECGINLDSVVKKGKKEVEWEVYKVFSEEIRGFEYKVKNPGKKFTYWRQLVFINDSKVSNLDTWIADVDYWYDINTRGNLVSSFGFKSNKPGITKDSVLVWHQMGDKRELRARCILEPALRDLRLYEDFRINRAIMNYERSKVLYVKKQKQIAINRKGSNLELRKSSAPKGGSQLTLGPNEDFEMKTASLQAADADSDGLLFLFAASAATSLPINLLAMRTDKISGSNESNSDSPFHQMIEDLAGEFSETLKKMFKWVIYRNIEAGLLEKTTNIKVVTQESKYEEAFLTGLKILEEVKAKKQPTNIVTDDDISKVQALIDASMEEVTIDTLDIPINIIIAEAIKPNPLDLAKTAFIQRKLGMVSSQTLSEESGYNWSQELLRQLKEARYGIWPPKNDAGQQDSSTSMTGIEDGKTTGNDDGVTKQKAKN